MLCHRHLPHQLVYRGSRDREEPEAAAGEQHHHASRLFALRANHHHQVKMVCKNAGTPRGDQRWNRWERGLEEGWKGATSLALLFWLGKNGGWKAGWKGARWARPERGESFIIIFYQFINNLKFKKIMAINLKAKETLIQVGELKGKYRYVLSTELYNKLPESKVIKEAALRSGVSRGVMQACWDAAGEVIKTWSTEGHSVAIPGLGTMRFGVRAKSVATVGEVAGSLITTRRVIFTPNVDIKDELQRTPIQITCIDRNGKVVKNVTSGDGGNVEDPDKDPNGGGTEGGGSGNTEGGGTSGGDAEGDVGM